jgi:excisionase family DNA binding protein
MLDCGTTRLYELIRAGELETYRDGASRKITTASLRAYVDRQIAQTKAA